MSSPARTKAEEKFAQAQRQAKQMQKDREKAQQVLTDKVSRLRLLRLAKEAADKDTAEKAAAAKVTADKEAAARKALLKVAAARR